MFARLLVWTTLLSVQAAGLHVHVTLVGGSPAPTVGRAWTAELVVRPATYHGAIRVSAIGRTRIDVLATRTRASYRARLVFPRAGLWKLTAWAGGETAALGTVRVGDRPPLRFLWPTSIDLEPDGSVLV